MRFPLFLAALFAARAQLPPSGALSQTDWPLFRAEVQRVEKQLAASPGNCWVMNEVARTWASGQQYPETVQWLERIADLGAGLDPSRDPLYKELRGAWEAFRITEGDLAP